MLINDLDYYSAPKSRLPLWEVQWKHVGSAGLERWWHEYETTGLKLCEGLAIDLYVIWTGSQCSLQVSRSARHVFYLQRGSLPPEDWPFFNCPPVALAKDFNEYFKSVFREARTTLNRGMSLPYTYYLDVLFPHLMLQTRHVLVP